MKGQHSSCLTVSFVVFQLHLAAVAQDAVAMEALQQLASRLEAVWAELRASFNQSLCLLSYTKSALL